MLEPKMYLLDLRPIELARPFEDVTKRALSSEVAALIVSMQTDEEEEITSVVSPCELVPVFDEEPESNDEPEILESWPINE